MDSEKKAEAIARTMQRLIDQKQAADALGAVRLSEIIKDMAWDARDLLEQSVLDDALDNYSEGLRKRGIVYSMIELAEYAVEHTVQA